MPQAATNGIEWLHSAFVFIRCTLGCIVHCINSSYSKYSLLRKTSETSIINYLPIYQFLISLNFECASLLYLPHNSTCVRGVFSTSHENRTPRLRWVVPEGYDMVYPSGTVLPIMDGYSSLNASTIFFRQMFHAGRAMPRLTITSRSR